MPCEVSNCCFCVELRTGSFVIGYLNLGWNILVTIITLLALIGASALGSAYLLIIIGVEFALVIINLIFIVTLLIGLHKDKRGAVKAYLIYGVIFTILMIALFIVNIVFGAAILNIIINVLDLVLTIYFLVVIRSYYLKMDGSKTTAANY